jgi:cytochrome c556
MSYKKMICSFFAALLAMTSMAYADDDPRHVRHAAMEEVRDAAKVLGAMMKGEREFEVEAVQASLDVFDDVSSYFGELFPEGSETGEGTEAAPTIWTDREGFEGALQKWRDAATAAIEADPQTLEEAKPVIGPIFNTCKGCHDNYRIDDE